MLQLVVLVLDGMALVEEQSDIHNVKTREESHCVVCIDDNVADGQEKSDTYHSSALKIRKSAIWGSRTVCVKD